MIAFDADVLSEILRGNAEYVRHHAETPPDEQSIPVVVVEEIIRGRLNAIRRAESGQLKISVVEAYHLFAATFEDLRTVLILGYDAAAQKLFLSWRRQGIRIATHDLRIAASCVASGVWLISRNRRDFETIPGLDVEFWR